MARCQSSCANDWASRSSTPWSSNELDLVSGDTTQTNQTTTKLGTFPIPNNIRYLNYLYTPLVDDTGAPALITLGGTNTLRLQIAGTPGEDNRKTMLNYLMLVPQAAVEVVSSAIVNGPYTEDASATVNVASRTVTVPLSGSARFYRLSAATAVSIKSVSISGSLLTLTW